ncbi:50S ribosomal protein L39e [archaeon CG10_big_fil_rev_8_21_14_0_10_43_11]|nr:MAG: 50S ribosomal protein L39e [archaeon CG10_big_fil_rev_8_21_14_0_10_43_11]
MASNKVPAKKKRLAKATNSNVAAPFWAVIRKLGKRRTHRWRLNQHMRRHWRRNSLKV